MTTFEAVIAALQEPVLGPVSWAEIIGDVTGAWCVWLVARQHILNWPIGLLNNVFFFMILWWTKIYADAVLQAIFAVLAIWGWWVWARGAKREEFPVRRTTALEWKLLAGSTVVATVGTSVFLSRMTDSPVPVWDACVFTLSLAATYGQAKKLLESWWIWILVDVLSVPLYIVRGLYPTSALYVVFLILCIVGLRSWMRELTPAEESVPA